MATSLVAFRTLPLEQQAHRARTEGRGVGWRWHTADVLVGLYHLPAGYYCELYLSLAEMTILEADASLAPANLTEYAANQTLTDLLRRPPGTVHS